MLALLESCQFPLSLASQPVTSNFCQSTSGGPVPLPIFFNGPSTTKVQVALAKTRLKEISKRVENNSNFKLMPYFFPKSSSVSTNDDVFELRGSASITKGAFLGILLNLMNKTAADYYQSLAKEYFLQ
jgi:hypothetical protein